MSLSWLLLEEKFLFGLTTSETIETVASVCFGADKYTVQEPKIRPYGCWSPSYTCDWYTSQLLPWRSCWWPPLLMSSYWGQHNLEIPVKGYQPGFNLLWRNGCCHRFYTLRPSIMICSWDWWKYFQPVCSCCSPGWIRSSQSSFPWTSLCLFGILFCVGYDRFLVYLRRHMHWYVWEKYNME